MFRTLALIQKQDGWVKYAYCVYYIHHHSTRTHCQGLTVALHQATIGTSRYGINYRRRQKEAWWSPSDPLLMWTWRANFVCGLMVSAGIQLTSGPGITFASTLVAGGVHRLGVAARVIFARDLQVVTALRSHSPFLTVKKKIWWSGFTRCWPSDRRSTGSRLLCSVVTASYFLSGLAIILSSRVRRLYHFPRGGGEEGEGAHGVCDGLIGVYNCRRSILAWASSRPAVSSDSSSSLASVAQWRDRGSNPATAVRNVLVRLAASLAAVEECPLVLMMVSLARLSRASVPRLCYGCPSRTTVRLRLRFRALWVFRVLSGVSDKAAFHGFFAFFKSTDMYIVQHCYLLFLDQK